MKSLTRTVLYTVLASTVLAGCATPRGAPGSRVEREADEAIVQVRNEMRQSSENVANQNRRMAEQETAAQNNLEAQEARALSVLRQEPRFDLILNNAPARDVFMALVAETPWSLTMHPDVKGAVSTSLRRVTIREALDALREMYGYDYRIDGTRISIYAPTAQTRSFVVHYLTSSRNGSSEIRVNSGSNSVTTNTGTGGNTNVMSNGQNNAGFNGGVNGTSSQSTNSVSTQIQTNTTSNLWKEMSDAIKAMVVPGPGKHVLITPQASLITVRAMPDELRQIEQYLQSVKGAVQRQVMLEAKIIDVELNDNYQSGIDWNRLFTQFGNTTIQAGVLGAAAATGLRALPVGGVNIPNLVALPSLGSGAYGLSIGAANFDAVLSFLEAFGSARVLSSPRIATLNNQRALLKVGTDEFFITSATPGSTTGTTGLLGSAAVNPPTLNWASFFSGIALDVTPQIDESSVVTMHVRPSVSSVSERVRELNLGSAGNYKLPTARSSVNETDTVVRIENGQMVAIGGLMQTESNNGLSGLPGASNAGPLGSLVSNQSRIGKKRELVVLIKPTVIKSSADWASTWNNASLLMKIQPQKVIEINGDKAVTK